MSCSAAVPLTFHDQPLTNPYRSELATASIGPSPTSDRVPLLACPAVFDPPLGFFIALPQFRPSSFVLSLHPEPRTLPWTSSKNTAPPAASHSGSTETPACCAASSCSAWPRRMAASIPRPRSPAPRGSTMAPRSTSIIPKAIRLRPRLSGPPGHDPQCRRAPGEGLFGDLQYNPKHALAEQLSWDAEHAPENVGFSHNVQARTAKRGDADDRRRDPRGAERRSRRRSRDDARPVRERRRRQASGGRKSPDQAHDRFARRTYRPVNTGRSPRCDR